MEKIRRILEKGINNFVFIGEAGSGKSEVALNFSKYLANNGEKPVHFFDMDMTKPLFRSRDKAKELEDVGVIFHYEEQFMDAPTLVGGVNRLFKSDECYVVMDVGGDDIGARSIGGFINRLNSDNTMIYYVLNAYRPWSYDIDHIDSTLGKILGVSHIDIKKLNFINNPNFGYTTTSEEVIEGCKRISGLVSPYISLEFTCVREELYDEVKNKVAAEVMPLHLYMTYPWSVEDR